MAPRNGPAGACTAVTLADDQRAMARYCLAAEPDPADATALGGDRTRWDLYRAMVRRRFVETVGDALPRTRKALGDAAFTAAVDGYLTREPPTTRYVRELGVRFVAYLVAEGMASTVPAAPIAPVWALDLARYEGARLAVACALDATDHGVEEFSMDRPAAFAPAHQVLRMAWDVHREETAEGPHAGVFAVLVVRDPRSHRVGALELSPIAADLLDAMAPGDRTVTACVLSVLARYQAAAGDVFMASFADLLGDLLDQGVLLGARAG